MRTSQLGLARGVDWAIDDPRQATDPDNSNACNSVSVHNNVVWTNDV